jgi:hypothetical protein
MWFLRSPADAREAVKYHVDIRKILEPITFEWKTGELLQDSVVCTQKKDTVAAAAASVFIHRLFLLNFFLLSLCIYVYMDVWRWASWDINLKSFFTAITYSDDAVYMRPLKCVMKCDVLQSFVNSSVHSSRHRNRETLLPFTNNMVAPHSVLKFLLQMVNSRERFLDSSLVVCWRPR